MVNVTISVSDQIKTDMDALSEVNWSKVCRNAISRYIAQRNHPSPKIELTLRNALLIANDSETGYTTIRLGLRIHNKMDLDITVDRILTQSSFFTEGGGHITAIGFANDLHRRYIPKNSVGNAQIHVTIPKEKIRDLKDKFKSTFNCKITCTVYVEGFRQEYNQQVESIIPIDQWNDIVDKALVQPMP